MLPIDRWSIENKKTINKDATNHRGNVSEIWQTDNGNGIWNTMPKIRVFVPHVFLKINFNANPWPTVADECVCERVRVKHKLY